MKNYKYILSLFLVSTLFLGCDDNDLAPVIDDSAKAIATFTSSATSGAEIDASEIIISISLDRPVKTSTSFSATQISGTATLGEDYEIDGGAIPAYATEGEIVISLLSDLDVEGNETASFEIMPNNIPDIYEVLGDPGILNLTIEDYEYCLWTLVANDAYGDGWQGGHILVEFDGNAVQYAAEHDTDTYEFPITKGADYTISYVSGTPGSGPGAPGYEEENSYTLTSPDGVVFADGPIPAEGVITSGTCN